ncbi:MAG: alpha/beta hydrolase [Planctomycetota bacterium]
MSGSETGKAKKKVKRSWRTRLVRILVLLVVLYVVWLVVALTLQERILFPGATAWNELTRPASQPGLAWEKWTLKRPDGTRGVAWFRAAQTDDERAPAVVFTHGNADIARNRTDMGDLYTPLGVHTLLLEYPGYDDAEGEPGQDAIVADGLLALDTLAARDDVDPDRIVYHGHSIGGGVAAQLAIRRPPAALILESTFTSMTAMVNRYLVPSVFLRHPFDTNAVLETLNAPVLLMHGDLDVIIFVWHATRNDDTAKNSTLVRFPDYGHDGCYLAPEYPETVASFLRDRGIITP